MKEYNEIKSEYGSKNYSLSDIRKSIIFFNIIRLLFTETFLFLISLVPFMIGIFIIVSIFGLFNVVFFFYLIIHFLFYVFYVKKEYEKNILPILLECNMIIKALKEIKSEKFNSIN